MFTIALGCHTCHVPRGSNHEAPQFATHHPQDRILFHISLLLHLPAHEYAYSVNLLLCLVKCSHTHPGLSHPTTSIGVLSLTRPKTVNVRLNIWYWCFFLLHGILISQMTFAFLGFSLSLTMISLISFLLFFGVPWVVGSRAFGDWWGRRRGRGGTGRLEGEGGVTPDNPSQEGGRGGEAQLADLRAH